MAVHKAGKHVDECSGELARVSTEHVEGLKTSCPVCRCSSPFQVKTSVSSCFIRCLANLGGASTRGSF
jgi:hypothetical protein